MTNCGLMGLQTVSQLLPPWLCHPGAVTQPRGTTRQGLLGHAVGRGAWSLS